MSRLAFTQEPAEQLFLSLVLLLFGLFIFPFLAGKGVQLSLWMNAKMGMAFYVPDWAEAFTRGVAAFACIFLTLVGALQLSAYIIHKVGLVRVW